MDKNNIFEHVSYEFDMYLYTFNKICEMGSYKQLYGYIENQNLFNAFWDAHFLHLRNLIDFFSCNCSKRTDINVKTIFNDKKINKQFEINDVIKDDNNESIKIKINRKSEEKQGDLTFKMIINKSVEHVTSERFKFTDFFVNKSQANNLTYFQQKTIIYMIKNMLKNIIKFIELLESTENIKKSYKQDFEDYRLKFREIKYISQKMLNSEIIKE